MRDADQPFRAVLRDDHAVLRRNGSVDVPRLLSHLHRCLGEGCDSFTLFGTTGEGASVGLSERNLVLESVIDTFGGGQVLVGVAASAPEDAAAQANPLLDAGGRGLLLAPPFYFKGVDDEGLYAWFSRAIEAMHAAARHLPLSPAFGHARCRCRWR